MRSPQRADAVTGDGALPTHLGAAPATGDETRRGRVPPTWERPTLLLLLLATSVTAVVCILAVIDGDLRRVVAAAAAFSFPAVAAVILRRHPRHAVGRLLLVLALVPPMGELAGRISTWEGALVPLLAAWVFSWYWIVVMLVPLVWLPSVFPTGQLVGHRWRPVVAVPTLAAIVLAAAATVQREFRAGVGLVADPWLIENPIGIAPWAAAEESVLGAAFFLTIGVTSGTSTGSSAGRSPT
jgi:hypothetical protein